MTETGLVVPESVERAIIVLRGRRVILDSDLATLYGVTVSVFNQAVKRNMERFPADFAFQLTREEYESLRSQMVILKAGRGAHRKYLPYVFTEHGAVMAASVLNSPKAVEMSVEVVRAFMRFRQILAANRQLAARVDDLERKMNQSNAAHSKNIGTLFDAVRSLMTAPEKPKRQIGFQTKGKGRGVPPSRPAS
ncbi:MAG TPA: ORF6N domain-containing protein [Polyangia bacterium]|nr:ORF6N domain-containing protein [Polyangia bacterium]